MKDIYLWTVTAVTVAVALNTLWRLWTDRARLWQEDLRDEDRLFAWRVVLFLVYPILTLVDLRTTLVTSQALGGFISNWTYGLFWYSAVPQGLTSSQEILLVLYSGAIVQAVLALSLIPALWFRPHPFLATTLGYCAVAVLGLNLLVDPLLYCVGMGGSRWHLAMVLASPHEKALIIGIYSLLTVIYFAALVNRRTRMWFVRLSHPIVAEQLTEAQLQWQLDPSNAAANARVAILYDKAGLKRQALAHSKHLNGLYPESVYSAFVEAMLFYRQAKYAAARKRFLFASDCPNSDPLLRAALLSAAACAAFAESDLQGALNLSERALEFDEACLVARMVKVDVFLRSGRKEQAGDEIVSALRRGLDLDLERKIPLDTEFVLQRMTRMQAQERTRRPVGTST